MYGYISVWVCMSINIICISGSPPSVMANLLDCDMVVCEFKLLSRYELRANTLRKIMKSLILPAMSPIISQLFFYTDSFGIKLSTKVDMPLNKETKPMYVRMCMIVFHIIIWSDGLSGWIERIGWLVGWLDFMSYEPL